MNQRLFIVLSLLISLLALSVGHASAQGQVHATPSNLQATASSATEVLLTWAVNSSGETEFVVYENGQIIVTLATGVTSITIGNLSSNSSHCHVANAYNDIGYSDVSNEACVALTLPMHYPRLPPIFRRQSLTIHKFNLAGSTIQVMKPDFMFWKQLPLLQLWEAT